MKKIILVLVVVGVLISTAAWAAWTVALNTTGYPKSYTMNNGTKMYLFRVDVISDANASGTQTLSTLINTAYGAQSSAARQWKDIVAGSMFYALEWSHTGTVTAPTIVVLDGIGAQLLSYATATTGAGIKAGNSDVLQYVPLTDLSFTSTTLGNTNVSAYYFWLTR